MFRSRSANVLLLLAVTVGLLVVLNLVEAPNNTIFWRAVFNAGHVPLFGMFALVVLGVGFRWFEGGTRTRCLIYLAAFVLTTLVGVLTEALQAWGPRDASVSDLLRDVFGSGAFLLFAFAFDKRARPGSMSGWRTMRGVVVAVAVVVLVIPIVPLVRTATAYMGRDAAFPRLCDFESQWEPTFVAAYGAKLEVVGEPAGWGRDTDNRVARVTFQPAQYSGVYIEEPWPDWSGYDRFVFEVYSELLDVLELDLRIHDTEHDHEYYDRFNSVVTIRPGVNVITVDLDDVREGPRGRELDLSQVRNVALFDSRIAVAYVLYLDSFRLER